MAFKHETKEAQRLIEKTQSWTAEIDGYDVFITRREEDGFTQLGIAPIHYDSHRMPLINLYPKKVSEIERVIAVLPKLLESVCVELRAAGLEDMRSKSDIYADEYEERCKSFRTTK